MNLSYIIVLKQVFLKQIPQADNSKTMGKKSQQYL